jgi:hypothetical protein
MKLGIVGHASEKFDTTTKKIAESIIQESISMYNPDMIISGHSPMGGVDIWAEEQAALAFIPTEIYAPTNNCWGGVGGFKERNLKIASNSDIVLVIVVSKYPQNYKGMIFKDCYHCKGRNKPHIKSGGCWTAWQSKEKVWRII